MVGYYRTDQNYVCQQLLKCHGLYQHLCYDLCIPILIHLILPYLHRPCLRVGDVGSPCGKTCDI